MSYKHQGLLYEDDGSVNLIVGGAPAEVSKGWAKDANGFGIVAFAPQTIAYANDGFTYTSKGELIVTGATPGASGDYQAGNGVMCRRDGAAYLGFGSGGKFPEGRISDKGAWQIAGPPLGAAWFRFNTGIVVTGAGVSLWADQSGNGRDLKQTTDTNRPALQTDGTILFDGADNFLKCDAFTMDQPETVYILFKQITWTGNDAVCDGNTNFTMRIFQRTTTPQLGASAASALGNVSLTLDTYGVVSAVFNGASSLIQLNSGAPVTGDSGVGSAGGFTIGSQGAGLAAWGNIQVKEAIVYPAAHDANMRRRVITYLNVINGT